MKVKLEAVSKNFESKAILDRFFLSISDRSVTSLLGPSGCGKTTLLKLISRLHRPDSGSLSIRGGDRVAYVFQEPRLLPWKTVLENVTYVMSREEFAEEQRDRAMELLETFEIADAATLHPQELSGGMARRVGIARALASPSDLLLMDEPLASLDIQLKKRLLERLLPILREYPGTVLIASHDLDVAATISDRVILLSKAPVEVVEDIYSTDWSPRDSAAGSQHPRAMEPELLRARIEAGLERHGSSLKQFDDESSRAERGGFSDTRSYRRYSGFIVSL